MNQDSTPILVGAGQYLQRDADPVEAMSPLDMMVECARRAAEDVGGGPGLLAQLDSVAVVNILSWPYRNAPARLAERLGAQPLEQLYTTMGGNTPQWLVNRTAEKIYHGKVNLALLAGAEAVNTVRRAHRSNTPLSWESGGVGAYTEAGDMRLGTSEAEVAHGLELPVQIFPLFENALRARLGLGIEEHGRRLGELCARLSAVAAENPYAWFQQARSAAEIAAVTAQNRYIGFPYTKFMNAIIDVDQGAAVLMTSVGTARRLGIPPSRWVYLWGAADAHDHWFVSNRVDYCSSPAIRVAGRKALREAGIGVEDVDYFDLYSCFPCAVQIARDMLGIAADDPRALTVTGGLPYHGGPGNNYSMHAIATMMNRLRDKPGSKGLMTALGWYITKHSVGVYSAVPKVSPWEPTGDNEIQAEIDAMPAPVLVTEANGPGTIETYTVFHDRDGQPATGIVVGRLEDGRRFLANTSSDRSVLETLETREGVGCHGTVVPEGRVNRFDPK
jgi:acetyl-CoA C-acetyltransferase